MKNNIKYTLTIESLSELTGYSTGTIHDFVYQGVVPKPKRWFDPSAGRKGLYPEDAVLLLNHYRQLMSLGRGKPWAVARAKERLAEFNHLLKEEEEALVCQ